MKQKLLRTAVLLVLLLGAGSLLVLAAYAPNGRELVSLGYLEKTFLPTAVEEGSALLQDSEEAVSTALEAKLNAVNTLYDFRAGLLDGSLSHSPALNGLRFKRGDVITLGTGSSFLLLAGEASAAPVMGTVVDVTAGTAAEADAPLLPNHRYLAAEQTVAAVTIGSDTAVLALEGGYELAPGDGTDYNMLADAMKAMGLFRGGDTGYGSGYDLERTPTRIEGLIMFLRLLGEEPAALATTAPCPFTDVPAWSQSYVAYAYEKGYTKGVGGTAFAPYQVISANEYLTFILRTLGYTDSGSAPDFTWDTALLKALHFGVLTAREHKLLTEGTFLRAQVVYVSYYALDACMSGTDRDLYTVLTASGALDKAAADAARKAVTDPRIR